MTLEVNMKVNQSNLRQGWARKYLNVLCRNNNEFENTAITWGMRKRVGNVDAKMKQIEFQRKV